MILIINTIFFNLAQERKYSLVSKVEWQTTQYYWIYQSKLYVLFEVEIKIKHGKSQIWGQATL